MRLEMCQWVFQRVRESRDVSVNGCVRGGVLALVYEAEAVPTPYVPYACNWYRRWWLRLIGCIVVVVVVVVVH